MSLTAIEALLGQKLGINFDVIGSRKIARAVNTRCSLCGLGDRTSSRLNNEDAYFQLLQTSPQEFAELVELLVVPETWFFRDRQPFDFLKDHIRLQELSKPSRLKFRVLSAPCSTGEEPYSIAIALIEAGLPIHRFSIDALDISQKAIAKARRGIYGKNSFRGDNLTDRQRYFQETKEGYEICSSVRHLVNYRQGNILEVFSVIEPKYDIIFCRNLLIYLQPSTSAQVIKTLEGLLVPDGLLFVGASETAKINHEHLISVRRPFTFAYQKKLKTVSSSSINQFKLDSYQPLSGTTFRPQSFSTTTLSAPTNLTGKTALETEQNQLRTPVKTQFSTPIKSPSKTSSNLSLDVAKKLADEGQIEAAIEQCQKYLISESASPAAYTLLGTLYQAKTENEKAVIYFKKALYLNPNCYEALMNLALLKEHNGDIQGAKILQQRIHKLSKTSP